MLPVIIVLYHAGVDLFPHNNPNVSLRRPQIGLPVPANGPKDIEHDSRRTQLPNLLWVRSMTDGRRMASALLPHSTHHGCESET